MTALAAPAAPRRRNRQESLAAFCAGLRFDDLSQAVVERLKRSVLDTIGCGLFGSTTPWGGIVARYAGGTGGAGASLWGRPDSTDAAQAALVNGTMAHGFELDDLHPGSRSHPGAVTLPVVIAIAEARGGLSGRDMLAALAAGYEVMARVGMAQGVSSFNRGWHPTGTAGAFGAAAAASRALDLAVDRTGHALGVAGAMPAGLMAAQFGAMVKRLFVGHAAFVGVLAARLAADGFTGIDAIFDAEFGSYLAAVSDHADVDAIDGTLGREFEILRVGYKFHACVGTNLTALDAIRDLVRAHGVTPGDVASVEVHTSTYQKLHSGFEYRPGSVMNAQMNLRYCAAAMMTDGEVFVDQFAEHRLADPSLVDLAARVRVEVDPDLDRLPPTYRGARVAILLNDGRRLRAERDVPFGHAMNPPRWVDLVDKFNRLAGYVLPADRLGAIVDGVGDLENVDDIVKLVRMIRR